MKMPTHRALCMAVAALCIILLYNCFVTARQPYPQLVTSGRRHRSLTSTELARGSTTSKLRWGSSKRQNASSHRPMAADCSTKSVGGKHAPAGVAGQAVPKVALLFLIRDSMPNEPVWRAFFELAGKLQLQPRITAAAAAAASQSGAATVKDAIGNKPMHPPLQAYPSDSYTTYKLQHGLLPDAGGFRDKNHRKYSRKTTMANPTREFACPQESDVLQRDMERLLSTSAKVKAPATTHRHMRRQQQSVTHEPKMQLSTMADAFAFEQQQHPQQKQQQQQQQQKQRHWAHNKAVHPLLAQQQLFSVYVHTAEDVLPKDSLFAGCELPVRLNTSQGYAQHVLVEAEVLLLHVALQDSANVKFVLVSETSIPLYPPQVVWSQLIHEPLSRVDACTKKRSVKYRWSHDMATDNFTYANWRVSSQWFTLTRPHALLAVADQHVRELFHRHCYSIDSPNFIHDILNRHHKCVADEHYFPSMLSSYGLEQQTDCLGVTHFVDWHTSGWHPITFTADDISRDLVQRMRGSDIEADSRCGEPTVQQAKGAVCDSSAALVSAATLIFEPLRETDDVNVSSSSISTGVSSSSKDWITSAGYLPLQSSCPLFARKFPAASINSTLAMALSCSGLQLGSWCHL